jgi:SPP1 gp7 family putative phage head morphogenesis protein
MPLPSFNRLVRLYSERMQRLFAGHLLSMIQRPGVAADLTFYRAALQLAEAMAREVAEAGATSWRQAAMKSYRGREIYEALRAEIKREGLAGPLAEIAQRNARLITSVPSDVGQMVTARARKLILAGERPEALAKAIRQWAPELAKNRIKLIARTEIARCNTDLEKARAESIGLEWAVWQSSEDERVRPSHRNLNGVLMNWSDPPQPEALIGEHSTLGRGFAGQFPNCRCDMLSLADLAEIKWPVRMYRNGSIRRITRAEFLHLAPELRAA